MGDHKAFIIFIGWFTLTYSCLYCYLTIKQEIDKHKAAIRAIDQEIDARRQALELEDEDEDKDEDEDEDEDEV